MNLNEIGSIASIVALIAMAIGGALSLFNKYNAYLDNLDKESEEYKNDLVSLIDDSTTSTERSNVSTYIQHVLSSNRHMVIETYLRLLVALVISGIGFISFIILDMAIYSVIFLFFGVSQVFVSKWFLNQLNSDIRISDQGVRNAWAKHVEKTFSRKQRKNS